MAWLSSTSWACCSRSLRSHQPERLPRHVGPRVRDALAVADLLGLEVALGREHGLGAADELLHQLLGADPLLGDRQGRDMPGRIDGQEDVEPVQLGIREPERCS